MTQTGLILARQIAEATARAGGRAYFVGGYVRDRLRGIVSKDIDIEIHGLPTETLRMVLCELGEPIEVGASFGVFRLRGEDVDIALPRREQATGRGHRDFQVDVDPFLGTKKACRRRDFTINAMMEDILTGQVIDHFGGQIDLQQGIIRHVDKETFGEDPLRALRAAQFAARFGFTIAPETIALCAGMDLSVLSGERIMGELEKALLQAIHPSIFFKMIREMQQLTSWFAPVDALIDLQQSPQHHPEGDVWTHTMLVLDEAAALREGLRVSLAAEKEDMQIVRLQPADPLGFMLAALCHDLGKAVTTTRGEDGRIHAFGHEQAGVELTKTLLGPLTKNRRLTAYVTNLVSLHMKPNVIAQAQAKPKRTNRLFDSCVDPEGLILLSQADHLGRTGARRIPQTEVFLCRRLQLYREMMARPYVQGIDLIRAGVQPGPVFTKVLAYGHKLRLAGVEKEIALRQCLAMAAKEKNT